MLPILSNLFCKGRQMKKANQQYKIVTETAHHQVIQFLEDRIYEHSSSKLHKEDGDLFSMVVRSESNTIIAGIAGWTWANACEITQLWVDESYRKNGLGVLLLDAAETAAKSKGCRTILVRSFAFQAPDFYIRHGYHTEHIIEDFPPGQRYHILLKSIS